MRRKIIKALTVAFVIDASANVSAAANSFRIGGGTRVLLSK